MEKIVIERFNNLVSSPELSLTDSEKLSLIAIYQPVFEEELDEEKTAHYHQSLDVAYILMEEANIGKIPVESILVYRAVKENLLPQ